MTARPHDESQKAAGGFKFQGYHYEAIEMRYRGLSYDQLAVELAQKYKRDFKTGTMRHWFARGGILEQPYLDFAAKENERRRQHVREELKKLTPLIPTTFEELLKNRFVMMKGGAYLTDAEGKKVKALDIVTVAALKELCKTLGFTIDPGEAAGDPVERYFGRLEDESPADHAEKAAS